MSPVEEEPAAEDVEIRHEKQPTLPSEEELRRFEEAWFGQGILDAPPRRSWFISPVVVMYIGFFFGPLVTSMVASWLLERRCTLRDAAFLLGCAGTIWCLNQGIVYTQFGIWSLYAIQLVRSTLNFGLGIAAYLLIRRRFGQSRQHVRDTYIRTAVAVGIGVTIFLLVPSELLIYIGR